MKSKIEGTSQFFEADEFSKIFAIDILSYDKIKSNISFSMKNAPKCFHKAIRDTILEDVPSVAIDRIFIRGNSSFIFNKELAFSIGLTPIDTNVRLLNEVEGNLPNYDLGSYDESSMLLFKMHVKHDGERKHVMSDDLKWVPYGYQNKTHEVEVTKGILLSVLASSSDEILLSGLGVVGYGWDHAKFKPASSSFGVPAILFKGLEKLTVSEGCLMQQLYPEAQIRVRQDKVTCRGPKYLSNFNYLYTDHNELANKVYIEFEHSLYFWNVESIRPKYQPAHDIFLHALEILEEKCDYLMIFCNQYHDDIMTKDTENPFDGEAVSEKRSGKYTYIELENRTNSFVFSFHGQCYPVIFCLVDYMNSKYGDIVLCSTEKKSNPVLLKLVKLTDNEDEGEEMDVLKLIYESLGQLRSYFSKMQRTLLFAIDEFDERERPDAMKTD